MGLKRKTHVNQQKLTFRKRKVFYFNPKFMKRIIIFDFNRTIYNPEIEKLAKDTKMVLAALVRRNFMLYLISRTGVSNSRKKLIDQLSIKRFFSRIILTGEKNLKDFRKLTRQKNIDFSRSFVIGDRIRQEITFGNILGLQTVWLQTGKFSNELPRNNKEQPKYTIQALKDILKIV